MRVNKDPQDTTAKGSVLIIRPAQISDYPAIWRVADAVWSDPHESDEMFKAEVSKGIFLASEVKGFIVGYLAAFPWNTTLPDLTDRAPSLIHEDDTKENWWHIHDVAVLPDWQDRGIAGALVGTALAIGRLRGFLRTMAISVSASGERMLWSSNFHVSNSSLLMPSSYPGKPVLWERTLGSRNSK